MSDEKAIAPYDPAKLMDNVRDRIRSEFVSLIPEDHWKALVRKAVDGFFEQKGSQYNNDKTPKENMENRLAATIGDVYEDPATHWIMVRLDSCECHCPFDVTTGKQSKASPHFLRVYELPVDEHWLRENRGKRVEIVRSMVVLA